MEMCLTLVNPHMLSELREQELEALWIGPADVGTVVWTLADYFRNQICTLPSEKSAQSWDWMFYPVLSHKVEDVDLASIQSCGLMCRAHRRKLIIHQQLFQSASLCPAGIFDMVMQRTSG